MSTTLQDSSTPASTTEAIQSLDIGVETSEPLVAEEEPIEDVSTEDALSSDGEEEPGQEVPTEDALSSDEEEEPGQEASTEDALSSDDADAEETPLGFFGAGQLMQEDQGDVRPTRGALDHPAAQFLGREFLLWLWWRSEEDFATAELPHYGTVDFWIDDHIQFRTPGDPPQITDLRGGAPATTVEARTALAGGKTVESARLGLRVREREYSFSIRAEGLELSAVKVPSDARDGIDDRLFERMLLLEELTGIVDSFFFRFLEQRLADGWRSTQLPAIRSWIADKPGSASTPEE